MKTPESPFRKVVKISPGQFTGKGAEIIGDPRERSGEIWYLDGVFRFITAELSKPAKPRPISIAKQAAWLNLSRQNSDNPDKREKSERERVEQEDNISAQILGEHFTQAMLEGTLLTLARAVVKELNSTTKKREVHESRLKKWNGYMEALSAVANGSSHPKQVTIQAVKNHIEAHRARYNKFGFIAEDISVRDIREGLREKGFGWLKDGTRKPGRPPAPSD